MRTLVPGLVVAGPTLWVIACLVPAFAADINLRVVLVSALMALLAAVTAEEFWRGRAEQLVSRWPAIFMLFAHGALFLLTFLALGIDAAAHRGALEAGGITIAVFGCGLDVCYPPEHAALLAELVQGGTAISEFDPGERPLPYYFPIRNRIIAGLSRIVLVVEAAEKSGSLITANYALEQNKEVLAVPGNITSQNSEGTNALIKQGARMVLGASDIVEELAPVLRGFIKRRGGQVTVELSEEERAVLFRASEIYRKRRKSGGD